MQTEVHFENIKHHIRTELRKATDFVFVAVAWFTDDDLFEELVNLSRKGIQIQLLPPIDAKPYHISYRNNHQFINEYTPQ